MVAFFISLAARAGAAAAAETVKDPEFKYPPIRLAFAESKLSTPALQGARQELVEGSQIMEDAIHASGMVYTDADLQNKLETLLPVEALGEMAAGFKFRIYVLKESSFNAMIMPTGSIYVNSGLFATLENFEQVRMALAHEVHHYLDQDIVKQFQKRRREEGALKVLGLIAAPAVAVAIGESDSTTAETIANVYTGSSIAVNLAYSLSVLGYSREDEAESDRYALSVFDKNKYDLESAKRTFEIMEKDSERYGKGFQTHLFMDHETGKQRAAAVQKFIKEHGDVPPAAQPAPDDAEYHRLTKPLRIENARVNIRTNLPQHALDDLERLRERFPDDPTVIYLMGEAYAKLAEDPDVLKAELSGKAWRKMGIKDKKKQKEAWAVKAREAYEECLKRDPAYPDPYRGRAVLSEKAGELDSAVADLEKYLTLKPDAPDRRYVKSIIEKLKKKAKAEAEKAANRTGKAKKREKGNFAK